MTPTEVVQEQNRKQRRRDLKELLDLPAGRRFLFDLLLDTKTFETSFTGNSGSFYNDGRKSVGLGVFHEIMNLEPDRFRQMWIESEEAEAAAQAKIDKESED